MYFNKTPHIENFTFVKKLSRNGRAKVNSTSVELAIRALKDGIFHIKPTSTRWPKNRSQAGLKRPGVNRAANPAYRLETGDPFGFRIVDAEGNALLTTPAGMTYGLCGKRSVFVINQSEDMQFYGMGEKMRGLELSGIQTKFWNTDVFADFSWGEIANGRPDPLYASFPYVIIKRGNTYVGILLDNPHATFMSTSESAGIGGGQMIVSNNEDKHLAIGAENGVAELYIIVGPSLGELTRKLQTLVGVTPLPPAWSLGYHQCRWGYKSDACIRELEENFTKHRIPCDGLWIDIDYMDSFKVFSFNKHYFPSLDKTLKRVTRNGRTVVPIIDPGVKKEKGYNVYDSGRRANAFCKNPEGEDFVGLVWPGETVFPDFSIKPARAWWARWVREFASHGFIGCWIDMNDPSTGPVLNEDMLFDRGREPHDAYHNQYANGMAQATREGFAAANPDTRPFVLSRSGYTGIGKYAALWTGDNMSNYHYLRNCVAVSLNLALSGVPFNGPDIGGFCGNCPPQLLRDWMKACFLFPFCRNHSMHGERAQEPWAYDASTLKVMRHFIQMRYQLRPYLYNLFIRQEDEGDAILRPLFYDFADTEDLPLGRVDDTFMVGPSILQGPVLDEHHREREVPLPGPDRWFSVLDDKWIAGGRRVKAAPESMQTALYIREASIIPATPELPEENAFNGRDTAFHVALRRGSKSPASYTYSFDDGLSYAYRRGKRSTIWITAAVADKRLDIRTEYTEKGYGKCSETFVLYDDFDSVTINGKAVKPRKTTKLFAGSKITVWTAVA